jgi:Fe-S-cluster containining protein
MPHGKPADVRCVNLSTDDLCLIHEEAFYPEVCRNFKMTDETCGTTAQYALKYLAELEKLTAFT